jgi:hypothetical protein
MLKRYLVTKSSAITPGLQRGIHVTKIAGLGNINNHQAIHVLLPGFAFPPAIRFLVHLIPSLFRPDSSQSHYAKLLPACR